MHVFILLVHKPVEQNFIGILVHEKRTQALMDCDSTWFKTFSTCIAIEIVGKMSRMLDDIHFIVSNKKET